MSVAHRPAERAAHPNGAPLRRVATGRPQAPRRSSPQVIVDAPAVGRRIFEGIRRPAAAPDWILIGAVIVLTFIGLVFVFSSSFAISLELHGDTRYFATRQLIGAAIGLVAFFICSRIDYAFWRRLSPLIMGGAIILLLAVLAPGIGSEQNGATRWIQVGALPAFQPSEFAKLAICIYVAAWLVAKGEDIKRVPLGLIPFAIIIALVGFLLMAEPDLGTFVTIAAIGVIMFFLAGAALRHMAVLIAGGAAALFAIIVVVGYGLDRFQAFFNAEEMAQDAGFQIINLVSTLGSGGLTGVGLGASRQKFFYVPSAHTDGVFAIIGEETGLPRCNDRALDLRRIDLSRDQGRNAGAGSVRHLAGVRDRVLVRDAGILQRRRGHAYDRPDRNPAALHQFRLVGPDRLACRRRHPRQHLAPQSRYSRGPDQRR